jgi:hypothetical protein
MTLNTLKIWRLLVPAALAVGYAILLAIIVGWWTGPLPDLSKIPYVVVLAVPAAIYYITPLRRWWNGSYHRQITENLRKGMVEIAGLDDDPERYTWKNLRSLFFKIIDSDPSLQHKASIAYTNGLFWTSFADSAALSTGYSLLSLTLIAFGVNGSFTAVVVFLLIGILFAIGQVAATKKQISIGDEQLEHFRFDYKEIIEKRLKQIDR